MTTDNSASIVSKVWNYAHVLKNAGVGYGDYVEQITYLLFLKLADEMTELGFDNPIPDEFKWSELSSKSGDALESSGARWTTRQGCPEGWRGGANQVHYRHTLETAKRRACAHIRLVFAVELDTVLKNTFCIPMPDKKHIRNSTAEFLIFSAQSGGDGLEVRYEEETIWLSQKLMARLFDVDVRTVSEHLGNIYESGEIERGATLRKFRTVQTEGSREVAREVDHYNLDAIISVGYRVNSVRATQFRQWATGILRDFAIKGYVLDRKRMENGAFLDEDYFERLLEEIREIRLSERRFYQKITDIYATALDYSKEAPTTREFFAKVQNKLHFAIHGRTAAELIQERADAAKSHMGLSTWENAPDGKILKTDVGVAKNYLNQEELDSLGRIVNAYLELAEDRARRRIPMTMEDWAKRLDAFLEFDDRAVLKDAGKVTAKLAKEYAECEFEKFRPQQDRAYRSDFDKEVEKLETKKKNHE